MEIRKLELSSQQLSSETYLIQSPEEDRPDFIEIPVEEIQRLKAKGRPRSLWFAGSSHGASAAHSAGRVFTLPTGCLEEHMEETHSMKG